MRPQSILWLTNKTIRELIPEGSQKKKKWPLLDQGNSRLSFFCNKGNSPPEEKKEAGRMWRTYLSNSWTPWGILDTTDCSENPPSRCHPRIVTTDDDDDSDGCWWCQGGINFVKCCDWHKQSGCALGWCAWCGWFGWLGGWVTATLVPFALTSDHMLPTRPGLS